MKAQRAAEARAKREAAKFQSPCGEEVMKVPSPIASQCNAATSFQSPCGEEVMKDVSRAVKSVLACFNPLAGKRS